MVANLAMRTKSGTRIELVSAEHACESFHDGLIINPSSCGSGASDGRVLQTESGASCKARHTRLLVRDR